MITLPCILVSALLLAGAVPAVPPPDKSEVVIPDATAFIRPDYQPLANLLSISDRNVPTSDNAFKVINVGPEFGELLFKDFRDAKRLIEMELFLFGNDKDGYAARDLLLSKVQEGVEVRYVHDDFGNFFDSIFDGRKVMTGFYDQMSRGGMDVRHYSPLYNLDRTFVCAGQRQHRKIIIVDEEIAYTGGMNITEGSISGWNDCMLRITGPAVSCLRSEWTRIWNPMAAGNKGDVHMKVKAYGEPSAEGKIMQVVPDGADVPAHMAEEAFIWTLDNAREYVWFQTPYFIPNRPLLKALKRAAERGVDVRVIIPLEGDLPVFEPVMRSYFKTCIESGVKLYLRNPPFVHSKTFVCDDYLVSIGSTNLDKLSLKRNFEVNVYIYDEPTALDLKAVCEDYCADSVVVTPELFETWTGSEKFNQKIQRMVSPWL